jgi:hypothetical protein
MTVRTNQLYRDYDSNGVPLLTITYDWDDALTPPQVATVHVTNSDSRPRNIQVTSTFNGKVYSFIVQPGAQINQAVPNNVQNRLQVEVLLPSGKINGLDWLIS